MSWRVQKIFAAVTVAVSLLVTVLPVPSQTQRPSLAQR